MNCAWDAYLNLLPIRLRRIMDSNNADSLQEVRLRIGQPTQIITAERQYYLDYITTVEDLNFCINVASRYSPWAAETMRYGYITAQGGHRIGICGQAVMDGSKMYGMRNITSVCIRVCRNITDIATPANGLSGSILIIGKPGCGKTTLLRDLVRAFSTRANVSVIDEREELFPIVNNRFCFPVGPRTDIISGCSKAEGINALLRTMTPEYIAVDEITAAEDCDALRHAGWCGVHLLATAHAGSRSDLYKRTIYAPILECGIFRHLIILRADKTWFVERM